MNRLEQLRQELAELKAAGLAIVEAAETEGRALTEDETASFEGIETQITAKQAEIAAQEALNDRRRRMEAVPAGGANPAQPRRANDRDPDQTYGFSDIGEFAVAVHQAVTARQVGGEIDSRLMAATPSGTHQGGGDAGEGYSLPPQFRDEVWELVNEFDEFGPLIDEEPSARREVKLATDETTPWGTAGIKAYWRSEGLKMTPSQLSDEGRTVPLHELYTLALMSEELLEDAPRLSNRVTRKAAEAIAWKKNAAIVEGTGVGQPLGWLKSPALVVVPKESGQEDGSILANNVIKMYSRMKMIPGDRPFWLVNQDTLPELMTMTIGDKPIWMPPNNLSGAPGGFLLGRPVRFSEFASTLGQQSDVQLISPRGYYGVRRAAGVKFASSIHLYFDYQIQAFRWTFRYGGQPHLSKAVSPNKGTATRSHFVTLGARSS